MEALVSMFTLDDEEAKSLNNPIRPNDRVEGIKNWLRDYNKDPHKIWTTVAAKYVAENMKEKDISQEIRDLLHWLDEIFEREEGI